MYWKYAIKRIINGFVIFALITLIVSAVFNTQSETVLKAQISEEVNGKIKAMTKSMPPEAVRKFKAEYIQQKYKENFLDRPIHERILKRTWDTVTLNLGKSQKLKTVDGETEVWKIVAQSIPNTLILFLGSAVIELIIGLWFGLRKAQKAGGTMDKVTSTINMIVYGMPSWWIGMLFIMLFAYTLKWLPSGGIASTPPKVGFDAVLDYLFHLILPMIILVFINLWSTAYLIRNLVLGTLHEDFVMTARARGIPEKKVLYGHTMKTSAPAIVTFTVLYLVGTLGGGMIFETIFSWPGMGNLYYIALQQNDIPVLMGNLAVTNGIFISALVVLDLIYGLLDPRIKVGGKA